MQVQPEDEEEEEGANIDLDAQRKGKCVVLKTSTRQTIFLPVVGLVDANSLKPSDLVGVNKDSYLILDTLPAEYDSRVKAMEVCTPTSVQSYSFEPVGNQGTEHPHEDSLQWRMPKFLQGRKLLLYGAR